MGLADARCRPHWPRWFTLRFKVREIFYLGLGIFQGQAQKFVDERETIETTVCCPMSCWWSVMEVERRLYVRLRLWSNAALLVSLSTARYTSMLCTTTQGSKGLLQSLTRRRRRFHTQFSTRQTCASVRLSTVSIVPRRKRPMLFTDRNAYTQGRAPSKCIGCGEMGHKIDRCQKQ